MDVFVYEYDVRPMFIFSEDKRKIKVFTDSSDFISCVKSKQNKEIFNERCYIGEVKEINKDSILNPFKNRFL
ncbi:hypothetical protein [Clostridium sardiniense]|uniref:hypothetical protein n=1 Tax=Clostridium sardiniense TaxID=29369 RepID=UPI0019582794|nr:hypothetical protein [Clostridium sardiniense]MBM7836335.1 hypothetical protein [Clostridium sardiniense]